MSIAEVRRRYDAGATIREIASECGKSYEWARRRIAVSGDLRSRGGANYRRTAGASRLRAHEHAACRLYQLGLSSREVAEAFGCSHMSVLRALERNDLPLNVERRSMKPADICTAADVLREIGAVK